MAIKIYWYEGWLASGSREGGHVESRVCNCLLATSAHISRCAWSEIDQSIVLTGRKSDNITLRSCEEEEEGRRGVCACAGKNCICWPRNRRATSRLWPKMAWWKKCGVSFERLLWALAFLSIFCASYMFSRRFLNAPGERFGELSTCDSEHAVFAISAAVDSEDVISELESLVGSMIHLSSKPLHLIFITNGEGAKRIDALFRRMQSSRVAIRVNIVTLEASTVVSWAGKILLAADTHHSGVWGMAKLGIPWLLPWVDRAIVLDTDMIFVKDPHALWKGAWNKKKMVYRMPFGPDPEKVYHICSCVVAVDAVEARRREVYPKMMRSVLEANPEWKRDGLYRAHFGDQSVYHGLLQLGVVGKLDEVWNREKCHEYGGALQADSRLDVGIVHHNCYNETTMKDGSEALFSFYEQMRWHWMTGDCTIDIQHT